MSEVKESLNQQVLNRLIENGDVDICGEYGEQGYDLPEDKKAILFADWNPFDKYKNFMEWIEANYEIEWYDEWIISYDHEKAYRSSPDSYGWEQQFRILETGELLTPDEDTSEWIEFCKIDDPEYPHTPSVLPSFISQEGIEAEGFELINGDQESGWYGRNDSPKEILEEYLGSGEYQEIVFSLNVVGQFSVEFSSYGRK